MDFSKLYYYKPVPKVSDLVVKRDVIVYGATPSGITAAIQAAKMGASVVIAEFGRHIGGITASGLGASDCGAKEAIGGLSRGFFRELGYYYSTDEQWTFEPQAAKYVFDHWIKKYKIEVIYNQHLETVITKGQRITEAIMEDGTAYKGSYFIDASYEGDLMAKSNVSYFVGRESNSTYKETYNGIQFGHPHHQFEKWIDPYIVEGDPSSGILQGITENRPDTIGYQGQGDHRIQAYNFRICLTKNRKNLIPFPKPPSYSRDRFKLLLRYIKAGVWDAINLHTMLPNEKTDLNNYGGFSTDNIGRNYEWPEGSYETREKIFQDHFVYNLGMLYFLANDDEVPQHIKDEVRKWGLAQDEFTDTGNWPHQLYIREARRMISDYIMTDHNCLGEALVTDSIGLASYQMDSHHCRRMVIDGRVYNEGDVEIPISPYPISYRSILPKAEECTNLLVPVCLSSSHIAYGSIRMEPVFMILGQSAGAAAALALRTDSAVQAVPYELLKDELIKYGQVLEWDETIEDDPVQRMESTFGKS
ncbi:FAD-dependent oxidoreductase [Bacillus infantis]|uniref:FAD-dependent oxidoreductase n=1 Tax=Bacillus infantis TaxID=324767 RepID=A0A5D4SLY7_9BACI|nr:FAD-dependent oxidoreductase [Bacillus infantis]TYS63314.1 FAD-dependent oxidoreductase [Bacillus infantis]